MGMAEPRRAFEVGYYVPPSIHPDDRYGGMYVVWVTAFAELFNRTGQHWALVPQPPSTPKPSHIWRCFSTSAKIRFRCDTCQNAWTSMHGQVTFQYFLHKGPGAGTVLFQLYGQKCRVCVRQRQRDRARAAAAAEGAGVAAPPTPPPEAEGATAAGPAGAVGAVGGPAGAVGAVAGPAGPAGAVGGPAGAGAAAPAPAEEEDDVPYSNPMWYPDEVRRVLMELYCQVSSKLYPHLPRPQPPAGHQRRFGRPQQAHDPALCQGCAAGTCRMVRR
ncbi:hypothetical protein FJT64_004449 [Amphibalanus amphitrite]|uniref:3CxxC-type domain-containing protein n=1 Tax=Amphibalanus amphitrite TaxID=1232801 RepID=A0A6A4VTR7_AMPAM|nr:hypothetical protein FJT64_004449 [Amphibalanus amphitrite]